MKEKIAIFIFKFHQMELDGFFEFDGKETGWINLPDAQPIEKNAISKEFYLEIADYLSSVYLTNINRRPTDEVVESIAIFFSKIHSSTLPEIFVKSEAEQEFYFNSFGEKE